MTESRICQMHTKAVLQLRGKLAEPKDQGGDQVRGSSRTRIKPSRASGSR